MDPSSFDLVNLYDAGKTWRRSPGPEFCKVDRRTISSDLRAGGNISSLHERSSFHRNSSVERRYSVVNSLKGEVPITQSLCPPMSRIKVCILTRDRFRYIGISDVLAKDKELAVLEKGPLEDDIDTVARFRPDVVILDITTVKVELQSFLKECNRVCPHAKLLVISINDKEEDIAGALRAGVRGYLNILHFADAITAAIKGIHEGNAWIAHTVMGRFINEVAFELKRRQPRTKNLVTEAQRKVLQLLAEEGLTNKEIAANLGIEERTVEFHITNLLQKFHLSNRNQLIIYAIKHDLVPLIRVT